MYVINADQVNSRSSPDQVSGAITALRTEYGGALTLLPERTAGDELQLLADSAASALNIILHLTRSEQWSVGCGVGRVHTPLPDSIREATGPAFIAGRAAVDRAKKKPTRFAIEHESATEDAEQVEAFLDLLLVLRSRRTPEGWELHDIVTTGATQAAAATQLGITPQAVSKRALAADLRAERASIGPLTQILHRLDTLAEHQNDTKESGETT